ncbi:PAS domain S-box-containing protein [Chitinophaga ginsengisegetis]|uniref:histidine kinase n=1 Tax=Chitinophaga ginsengisegetis TaxID=393003 RepID=A0A1T5N8L7_9BACT|nr:ATP-binding protein [Chitinophaga ginsengisegetis]SKC96408.1 PAS domain S-box-containing protein [Chitinophaga ginsengisegetis]
MQHQDQFLAGGGEMGRLIQSMDWSTTSLGPVESWPQSLKTTVSLCLSSTFPALIAWGPDTIQIYNDSYRPICGDKHPVSMGQSFRVCWETALPVVGDAFTRGQSGEGTYIKDQRMFLDRNGYLEEAFMTFSFAPIRNEAGEVGGIFHTVTETTDKMLAARRTQVVRDLSALIGKAETTEKICDAILGKTIDFSRDIPFLLLYQLDSKVDSHCVIAAAGINAVAAGVTWPFDEVLQSPQPGVVTDLSNRFGNISFGPYPEAPRSAVVLPVNIAGQQRPWGFVVAGVSARRTLDDAYLNFYELLGNAFSIAFSNVHAYEQAQQRTEALAAIDKAKTAFFNNVSHEFRTPLTLMIGPLEELLQQPLLQQPPYKINLDATYRNTHRLLKLVNNLLDVSRVEANRLKAVYQPVNLATLTTDLASSFQSIIEKAGMQLNIDCVSTRPVYIDVEIWEKIILNLLSNAFKFTLEGSISVILRETETSAILQVKDTGVGIPEKELPHMFERFHRVENSPGRTHEGSGIGLSLVSELVRLHAGTISVESSEGTGTTFTIHLPFGNDHLPREQISETGKHTDTLLLKGAFLKEAYSLLDNDSPPTHEGHYMPEMGHWEVTETAGSPERAHVLIVDNNADMRNYLARLLEKYFYITTAKNGLEALEQVERNKPDLILSDIMMPVMNGKDLLERVRGNPVTAQIPVIFLSARAGGEARIDGLEAGADDYLVKPFSAGELLTKVKAHIKILQLRNHAEQQLKNLFEQAPVAICLLKGLLMNIEVANEIQLQYWGRTAEEVMQKPLLEALPELKSQGMESMIEKAYVTGKRYITGELPLKIVRFGKAEDIIVRITFEPLYEESGNVSGIMCVTNDITHFVAAREAARNYSDKLEFHVEDRTTALKVANEELKRTNRELEDFVFISSHDLQEPLRKIQTFGNIAMSAEAAQQPVKEYLEKMIASASRMSGLIKDLLNYSKLNKSDDPFIETDLNVVMEQVLSDLEPGLRKRNAHIEISPLPHIKAVPLQMNQLFHNLLDNSLKFNEQEPVIRVSVSIISPEKQAAVPRLEADKQYYELVFRDNGIGFEQKYADQVFTIFKRLVKPSEYPGSGIGLTICRKVVLNHGGYIYPESQLNEGTTFYVYLPVL